MRGTTAKGFLEVVEISCVFGNVRVQDDDLGFRMLCRRERLEACDPRAKKRCGPGGWVGRDREDREKERPCMLEIGFKLQGHIPNALSCYCNNIASEVSRMVSTTTRRTGRTSGLPGCQYS